MKHSFPNLTYMEVLGKQYSIYDGILWKNMELCLILRYSFINQYIQNIPVSFKMTNFVSLLGQK